MSSSLPEIILQRASGQEEALNAYAGQVLLVVNTASQCGFTPQYEALEQLQQHFGGEGFIVLAFPCNQFGRQEPGDDETIASFCETRFHTTFPLFAKTEVNGPEAHPLFTHLKAAAPGVLGTQAIKWNFTKFLVDRRGQVRARFAPSTDPLSFISAIKDCLRETP
jgi:glutathione peroxidase